MTASLHAPLFNISDSEGLYILKQVTVAQIGAGFITTHHNMAFKTVSGVNVRLKTVSDIVLERAKKVADKFGYEKYCEDYRSILSDPEIDLVDICTVPFLHKRMVEEVLASGKNVICEKPLTGYFGVPGDPEPIGNKVPKAKMYASVIKELDELDAAINNAKGKFMYSENYVYSPNMVKAAEILAAKKSRILLMRGEESLRGSSSPQAGMWNKTGGGCLIRGGTHPLSGVLWLKSIEAAARGVELPAIKVTADTGRIVPTLSEEERRHLLIRPQDVEDVATVTITFADGTKALVLTGDVCLGGVKNEIDVYANDATLRCRITPNDNMETYFLDENGLDNVYLAEMLPNKLGWQKPFISEEIQRGYSGEMQDFVEAVAFDHEPRAGYQLAKDTMKVLYGAYLSAEEGRTVTL